MTERQFLSRGISVPGLSQRFLSRSLLSHGIGIRPRTQENVNYNIENIEDPPVPNLGLDESGSIIEITQDPHPTENISEELIMSNSQQNKEEKKAYAPRGVRGRIHSSRGRGRGRGKS